jgi:hypothetical protein
LAAFFYEKLQVLLVKHLHRYPSGYLIRAASVLVATDIEPVIVLPGSAILANVCLPSDLYNSSEFDRARTRYCVASAADICTRCGDARLTIGLALDRIEPGDMSVQLVIFARMMEHEGNVKSQPKHRAQNEYEDECDGSPPGPFLLHTISNTFRTHAWPTLFPMPEDTDLPAKFLLYQKVQALSSWRSKQRA